MWEDAIQFHLVNNKRKVTMSERIYRNIKDI